jgi:hypothetical protein
VLALNVGMAGGELVYKHGAASAYTGGDQAPTLDGDGKVEDDEHDD